MHEDTGREKCL